MNADWGIAGNERAVHALRSAVAQGAPAHAYLLAGPEGVGRALAARRLAQALNCTADDRPCGECDQCRRIENCIHSDVQTITLEAPTDGVAHKVISTEQIRELEASVALAPYEGRTRVVIIDPAGLLSDAAQNTFLKTLEEPPPNVVLVLVAADKDRLLETIRSRCARIDFHLAATGEVEDALLIRGVEPAQAKLLARLSGGRAGWAISAATDPTVLERRARALATARSLLEMPLADRFDLAERMKDAFSRDRAAVLWQLEQWQSWWRDVMLIQSQAPGTVANLDLVPELETDAAATRRADVARYLQALTDARANLNANVQPRIALDAAMLAVPAARLTPRA